MGNWVSSSVITKLKSKQIDIGDHAEDTLCCSYYRVNETASADLLTAEPRLTAVTYNSFAVEFNEHLGNEYRFLNRYSYCVLIISLLLGGAITLLTSHDGLLIVAIPCLLLLVSWAMRVINTTDSFIREQNSELFAPLELQITHKRGSRKSTHQHVFYVEFIGKTASARLLRLNGDRLERAEEEALVEEEEGAEGVKLLTPRNTPRSTAPRDIGAAAARAPELAADLGQSV